MSAEQLIQYLSWAIYLFLFAAVLVKAVRHPLRANLDITLLFGASTLIILVTIAVDLGLVTSDAVEIALTSGLLLALPYLLLRLVDDFSDVPHWLLRLSEFSVAVFVVAIFFVRKPPGWLTLLELV